MSRQLDIFGREVDIEEVPTARTVSLSDAQRAILRHVDEHDTITSSEAGRIIHAHRTTGRVCKGRPGVLGTCCRWMATDGTDACRRLADRKLITRKATGLWGRP